MNNHNDNFWESLNRNIESSIVFSCGPNSYKHPAGEVVDFFEKCYYKIKYTNRIGGLIPENNLTDKVSIELDLSSEQIENREIDLTDRKDLEFEFELI